MKVAFEGLDLPEGKTRYGDPVVAALVEKFKPAKISPYYFEFIRGGFEEAEAVAIAGGRMLDLLILDLERLENRLSRADSDAERSLLTRCIGELEQERPLCDAALDAAERQALRAMGAISLKPVLRIDGANDNVDRLCEALLDKAGKMFFYTAGKQEVHAWLVDRGADAVTCAGKIHTDLARGFIKAEIIPFETLMTTHSMQSARTEGLTRLVDRDYVIEPRTVLEIRFNV
ncbi:MAG: DUF933 domain-containing protein [Kiritimatiellae bacterium]|nr:DUF933 domain-containing protein [Kiritimatiellia bacterium]